MSSRDYERSSSGRDRDGPRGGDRSYGRDRSRSPRAGGGRGEPQSRPAQLTLIDRHEDRDRRGGARDRDYERPSRPYRDDDRDSRPSHSGRGGYAGRGDRGGGRPAYGSRDDHARRRDDDDRERPLDRRAIEEGRRRREEERARGVRYDEVDWDKDTSECSASFNQYNTNSVRQIWSWNIDVSVCFAIPFRLEASDSLEISFAETQA
jgi:U4/U6.U5 tri-snRNP-associated protein 3